MTDPTQITGYHAHLYFSADEKPTAEAVRAEMKRRFPDATYGRWHDSPVGPHPRGSTQIAFGPDAFAEIAPWLALNRQGITVFLHPETGQDLEDHRDRALWLGASETLDLSIFDTDADDAPPAGGG